MLLFFEIGLTIWAWKRGWKGWALLPGLITFAIGFFIGLTMVGSYDPTRLDAFVIFDILSIIVLIVMVAKPRRQKLPVVYHSPVVPAAMVPEIPPAQTQPVTVIEPVTVLAPVNRASLVLPDESEIAISAAERPVGRNDLNHVASPEELKYISRQHIMIKSEGSRYYVEDRTSPNNTKVNGINITGKGKQMLNDGDRIDLADVVSLKFKLSGAY